MSLEHLSLHARSKVLTQCLMFKFVLRFISKKSWLSVWQNAIKFHKRDGINLYIVHVYFFLYENIPMNQKNRINLSDERFIFI